MTKMDLPINQIIYGDARLILKKLPSDSIDLIFTDPPWFISKNVVIHRSINPKKYKYVGKDISLDFGEWDHFESEKDYWLFTKAWLSESVRVLKPTGHLISFFDRKRVSYMIRLAEKYGMAMRQFLHWIKSNPVPRARKVNFMDAIEQAVWFTKNTKSGATFNYRFGQQVNYVKAAIPGNTNKFDGKRIHPTQKPSKFALTYIPYLSNENDIVLDPFCGSGIFLAAAKYLGRRYIGIDIGENCCKKARKSLAKTHYQIQMYV